MASFDEYLEQYLNNKKKKKNEPEKTVKNQVSSVASSTDDIAPVKEAPTLDVIRRAAQTKSNSSSLVGALEEKYNKATEFSKRVKEIENHINTSKKYSGRNGWVYGKEAENKDRERLAKATAEYNAYLKEIGYKNLDELKGAYTETKAHYKRSKYEQAGVKLAEVKNEADFEKITGKGLAPDVETRETVKKLFGGIKIEKSVPIKYYAARVALDVHYGDEEANDDMAFKRNYPGGNFVEYKDFLSLYKNMTDEEFKIYEYHLIKDEENGTSNAKEYIDKIEQTLEKRKAQQNYDPDKSNIGKVGYGAKQGFNQFVTGLQNAFTEEDEYIPINSTQLLGQQYRGELGEEGAKLPGWLGGASAWQVAYDITSTTSNMLPSIAVAGVSNAAVPGSGTFVAAALMGTSAKGNAYQEMLNLGYDKEQAQAYSTLVGLSEAGLSYAFGGISKLGGKITGKGISKAISGIDNALLRYSANVGLHMGAEALEEGAQEALAPVFENLALGYEKNTLEDTDWEEVAYAALLGGITGGVIEGTTGGKTNALTKSEQAVFDKLYDDAIAEKEKNGTKLTSKQKTDIYNNILENMEKGNISIDTIEEVLGGETYSNYKSALEQEENLQKEFDTLNKMKQLDMTGEQIDRRAELKQQLEELKNNSNSAQLKARLKEEVYGLAKDSRLAESYNEETRKTQAFKADLTQYNEKQRKAVERAINSGVLNNTNKSHALVNTLSKIEAEKGIVFDYTNNEKLKKSGFAIEGKTVNGFVQNGNVTLNVQSSKTWQSVVGHEITHVLEGTDAYSELQRVLFEVAESKGELESRRAELTELYKNIDADIDAELTADLVGDYLFGNKDFINKLTGNKRTFRAVYNEIKYLCKVATGKQLTEIEKVRQEFDKAWKELSDKGIDTVVENAKAKGKTQLSVSETTDGRIVAVVDSDILGKIDTKSWDNTKKEAAKKAASNALKQFSDGIVVDGITRKVNRVSRREYTRSNDTEKLYRNAPNIFADKMRAADIADDIVVAATDWNRDGYLKHLRDDNFVDFDHGTTLIMSGNAQYIAEVVVGITKKGEAVLYDVVDMTPTTFEIKEAETSTTATTQNAIGDIQEISATNSIPNNSENVNRQYLLSETNDATSDTNNTRFSLSESDNTLEKVEKTLYNKNNPLSIVDRASKNNNSSINWVYKAEIFSVTENKLFHEKISEINQGSQAFEKNSIDEYMLPIGNKIVFTDGNYDSPYVREVIEVLTEYQTEFEEIRRRIFNVEKGESAKQDALRYVKNTFGEGRVVTYTSRNNGVYGWEDRRRKGKTRRTVVKNYLNKHYGRGNDSQINETKAGLNGSASFMPDDIAPVRKSLSNTDEQSTTVGTPLKDLAFEQDIAPVRDDVNYQNQGTNVSQDFPVVNKESKNSDIHSPSQDDIAPIREDKAIELKEKPNLDNSLTQTVEQKVTKKIRAVEAELANNRALRKASGFNYNRQIAKLQEQYNAKKNKNTKTAYQILQSISRLERLKASNEANFAKRISDLEARAEKMKSPKYTRAMQKQAKMQEHANWAANLLGDTSTWVDKKLGLQYATNTERRNLRDIVRDEAGNVDIARADAIDDALNGQYNLEQAELNRELARSRKKYADLKITNAEDAYIQMLGEFRHNPETSLTAKDVQDYYEKHKNKIDTAKVDKIIDLARQDYDNWLNRVNAELKKQGMREIPYRQGYFPHFTEPKQNFIKKLLNWKTQDTEIPTSIAGLTEAFKPVKSWQSFDKTRHTDTTDYSFTKGFDTYSQGVLDWIYHLDTLQKRRAVENHIRYTHSDEGVQERIKEVYANEELDANEAQAQIEGILSEAKNPLNNFVQDFTTHTNILAGKKSSLDRVVEQETNRHIYSVMTNVQNRLSANMVLANVRSALTNFIPITQSWAQVSPMRSLRATKDTIANAIKDDGLIDKSTFLTNRLREVDNLHNTAWDKVLDKAGIMFEVIDNFSSQVIWRSKYSQNLANGMSEREAIKNADQFAENVMAGRSKGNEPTLFNAKNPFIKAFTAFQLEVNNQYGYFFKDVPNDLKAETNHWKLNLAKGYTTAFIGAYVYNALLKELTGSDAALDPIGIIEDLLRDLGLFDDDEEKEPSEVVTNLVDNVVEELPFVGGLFGGGRIPISSALPYSDDGLTGFIEDVSEGNWGNVSKEMMNPILNVGLPVGGGQIKKTYQGLSMFNTNEEHPIAGSYTDSGNLRFPIDDTIGNRIQAGLFGQWASENARNYFDNDIAPLNEKQIQEYIDVGMPIEDYWKYRKGLSQLQPLEGKKSVTLNQQGDYIGGLDLTVKQKNILINNLTDRKTPIDFTGYENYQNFEEFDFATRYPEKYKVLKEQGISVSEYKEKYEETAFMYTDDFSWAANNPNKYTLSKVVTDDVAEYKKVTTDLYNIKADKDSSGKSISGSRKEKVEDYINNLDIGYGAKIILFKCEYPSDETYDYDIIKYLKGREDISYSEKKTILEELGFKVDENGNIFRK